MAMTQRRRSLLTLSVMAALCAGGGLYAYYGVQVKQEKDKADKEKKELIFPGLEGAKLAQLTVTAKGQTTVLAHATKPEGWSLVSPVNAPADRTAIVSLIDRLAKLKSKAVVEEKAKDLARYGLATPHFKVVARLEDGKEIVLRAGDENGFDSSVYVATGDSRDVLQAEGGFKWTMEKDSFELRDKRIMPFEDAEAAGLEVSIDGASWTLKKEDGKWQLVSPIRDRADEQAVNRVVMALSRLQATRFVTDTAKPEEIAAAGLDQPRLEVVLSLTDGTRLTLAAVQKHEGADKRTLARRHEATFIAEVSEGIFTDLGVKSTDLRDKSLIVFDKDKVARVSFQLGGESLTLERKKPEGDAGKSEDWAITAPTPGETRKWKMNSVLWGLSSFKAVSVVEDRATDLAKYGLDKPFKTVTLFDAAGKELGTVVFGKLSEEREDRLYAQNKAEPRVFLVDTGRMGELPSSRADLEEPKATTDGGAGK